MFLYSASVFLIWNLVVVLTAAEPVCDPETQYLLNGECCQKCKPGTSMTSVVCRSPECTECEENEYTDEYNTKKTCELQPYCDPSKDDVNRNTRDVLI
ncbi:tumor necrosis factor receptor superfamily member 5 [Boleophthalmus pectinirostris]|uniref:tumor necrosis factor receptor superfamily member 5 n=1 Tax=Boleophthalmus pectinirostris TaxID=150288 RepID=UPI0024330310|nr:tumor necrosis factor receptor superfamily member 5 [Boleophthalmus pectinirostris]